MKLAIGVAPAPFLKRRTVFIGDEAGSWCPLGQAAAKARIVVPVAAVRDLPAAIRLLSAMKLRDRHRLETAVSGEHGSVPRFVRPVDDRAKVMVVGGWKPVSRPDLELDHVTPHVMARWMDAADFRRPPITVFKKVPSAIADPGVELALPEIRLVQGAPSTGPFEADAALAVVIGRPALRVPVRSALRCVFGLSLMLDVWNAEIFMEEARVRRGMLSKNLSNLSPLGPWIQQLNGNAIPVELEVTLTVGGTLRQRFHVGDFAYRIAEVISFCSSVGLAPGDVLAFGARIARGTGPGPMETPVGIAPGDTIEVAAQGIGRLTAEITAAAKIA